jgi:hypothetical protein
MAAEAGEPVAPVSGGRGTIAGQGAKGCGPGSQTGTARIVPGGSGTPLRLSVRICNNAPDRTFVRGAVKGGPLTGIAGTVRRAKWPGSPDVFEVTELSYDGGNGPSSYRMPNPVPVR